MELESKLKKCIKEDNEKNTYPHSFYFKAAVGSIKVCVNQLCFCTVDRNLPSDAKQEHRHQTGRFPNTRYLQAYALSWVLLSIVELEFAQKKLVFENELFTENKLSCFIK